MRYYLVNNEIVWREIKSHKPYIVYFLKMIVINYNPIVID